MTYYQGFWEIDPPHHPLTVELTRQMEKAVAAFGKSVDLPHPRPRTVEQGLPVPKKKPEKKQVPSSSQKQIPSPRLVILALPCKKVSELMGCRGPRSKVMPDVIGKGKGKLE